MAKKSATNAKQKTVPDWLVRAMQGVVFWMGLKRAYYKRYKLSEGAIVDELTSLLAAALGASGTGYKVTRELKRDRLVPPKTARKTNKTLKAPRGRKPAVDIAIEKGGPGRPCEPIACIEVKRAGQPFESDVDKLAKYKKDGGGAWSAFVLVVGEKRPGKIVTENGYAPKKKGGFTTKTKGKAKYTVRRVCKALTSSATPKKPRKAAAAKPAVKPAKKTGTRKSGESGYWACALEVQ